MKRLAVVDMMFRWPPDGGARVDLKETITHLSKHYQIKLFAPKVDCIVSRGEITEPLPFETEIIPFELRDFTGPAIVSRFKTAIDRFSPGAVFLADGFHVKPWVAQAVSEYPFLVRFYAYENLCLRYNGLFMRGDHSCYRSGLSGRLPDMVFCTMCGCKAMINDRIAGKRGFSTEFLKARGYSPWQWKRTRNMLNNARKIVVYNHLAQEILSRFGWTSYVVPGGIETADFPRKPLRAPDGTIRLGLIGRVTDMYKGIVPAVRAIRSLHEKNINAELHLTGQPDERFGKLPGIIFRGWFSRKDIGKFYESIDICIVPSIWQEPFGIVTLEAMSSGRPVIASDVAGQREIIRNGTTGWLVAPNSAEAIAGAVVQCLENPEKTREMVDRAAVLVTEQFNWAAIVETYTLPLVQSLFDTHS